MPGEIADAMLDGTLCQVCGEFLGDGDGFPVTCESCGGGGPIDTEGLRRKPPRVIPCAFCDRSFRNEQGLRDHLRDKHGAKA